MRHALLHGELQPVIARVDIGDVRLNGSREGIGLKLPAACGTHQEIRKTGIGLAIACHRGLGIAAGDARVVILRL